jgi:hypothetical protein
MRPASFELTSTSVISTVPEAEISPLFFSPFELSKKYKTSAKIITKIIIPNLFIIFSFALL